MRRLKSALLAVAIVAATLSSVPAGAQSQILYASTLQFIESKFVGGQYVEGYSAGKPDWGFSVEALLQLKSAGLKNSALSKAINYNLASAANLGTPANPVGFLYSPSKALLVGRAGEYLFASKVFGRSASTLSKTYLSAMKSAVAKDGTLAGGGSSTFSYSWVALGLRANGESKLANLVAKKLATFVRADGGFGSDLTADTATAAADATGIALMALHAAAPTSSVISKAVAWLKTNTIKDHFESWGDADVNGTAYATMGLSAVGQKVSIYTKYLISRIASDGGLTTPWSNGVGDTYATVQGFIALHGLSYLDLLPR
ncbi:MAG: hypothetical protein ACKOWJ_02165 [Micrococcales bacterium]